MDNETGLFLVEALRQEFIKVKNLAEDAFYQLRDYPLYREPFRRESYYPTDEKPYSIGIIMQRTIGHLKSRWTDFLTTDGEKEWRNREKEFVSQHLTNEELIEKWHEAWMFLFKAIVEELEADPKKLMQTIQVNKHPITVFEALLRQITHHTFFAGQIVVLAKAMKGDINMDFSSTEFPNEPYKKEAE